MRETDSVGELANHVVLTPDAQPGRSFVIAVFGINGPISVSPRNYIWSPHAAAPPARPTIASSAAEVRTVREGDDRVPGAVVVTGEATPGPGRPRRKRGSEWEKRSRNPLTFAPLLRLHREDARF